MSHTDPKLHGVLAEFEDVGSLMAASRQVRDFGYTKWDAHTPFPVHGLDEAMGVKPTRLPWLVLICGATGLCIGFLLQWWTNAVDYPFRISGKPFFSLGPATPIMFELTILLSSFAAFFGMLIINGMPRWYSPLFSIARFKRATDDRFFIAIEAKDPSFEESRTTEFLAGLGASAVERVPIPEGRQVSPQWLRTSAWIGLGLLSLPPVLAIEARYSVDSEPPIHIVPNMDWQPMVKAQSEFRLEGSPIFSTGRSMRPDPEGVVARGEEAAGTPFLTGKDASGAWLSGIPADKDAALMERGQERFGIFCSACHGQSGKGDGLVHQRATELAGSGKSIWVQPTDLISEAIVAKPPGEIFGTITDGIRNMPGYRSQIPADDRWAIVFYLQALQRAQQN